MIQTIRPALLPAATLLLVMAAAPLALAQNSGDGYSVHTKTKPGTPPEANAQSQADGAETQAAAAPDDAEQAPKVDNAQPAPESEGTLSASGEPEGEGVTGDQAAAFGESNALGVTEGWGAEFGTAPPQTSKYTGAPEQEAIVEQINQYFNTMTNLEGRFLQTDANDERKLGEFYLQRPGKVLFDYSPPSRQKIISNGEYLAIENHDLKTSDRYPLESTPFKLLLKEEVNLQKDANIVALDVGENIVVLTVEDKEDRSGQIRLFFEWPELQLKEWIITDAQGLNTRIQLAELETNKDVDPELFTFSKEIGLPKFRGGSN